jgi:hypothetical protein
MPSSPKPPDVLPSLEHNGIVVTVLNHHGYSTPDRGALPKSRILYGAHDQKQERHWRSSFEEIVQLIDRGFKTAPLASGV